MAKTDEKVMEMVERELKQDPDIGVDALREKAAKVNPEMASLTLRQFNARYPLQVKRRQKAAAGDGTKKTSVKKKVTSAVSRTRKAARARRAQSAPRAPATKPAADAVDRDAIRSIFHRFARELTAAGNEPQKLVDAMASVDKYVDQVAKAARS